MSRPLLPAESTTPAVAEAQGRFHGAIVDAVRAAVATHAVVVVGMGWNPHVRWARQALDAAGIAHHDIDHGNYVTGWKKRLAIKLWSGWPTFPQVFVRGTLVGGNADVRRMIADGSLRALLDDASP